METGLGRRRNEAMMQSQERSQLVPCWVGVWSLDVSSESSLARGEGVEPFFISVLISCWNRTFCWNTG